MARQAVGERQAQHLPVLVYGTLRPGGEAYTLVEDFVLSHETVTVPGMIMYSNTHFPYVTYGAQEDSITASLVHLSSMEVLDTLDTFEGYHGPGDLRNHYDRVIVEVNGMQAYIYVVSNFYRPNLASMPVVSNGDWLVHYAENPPPAIARWMAIAEDENLSDAEFFAEHADE